MVTADYEKAVKHKLIDLGKTQAWLFDKVKEETGLYCDYSYFLKICRGVERGTKVVSAINSILGFDSAGERNGT